MINIHGGREATATPKGIQKLSSKDPKGGERVSKRINENFLKIFMDIDRLCCDKFGLVTGGVTEYISRLNNARFAPDRDDVLPKLVRYRNLRNRFAHEPDAVRKSDELAGDDIRWITRFRTDLGRKRDPISKYLKQASRYAFFRKLRNIALVVLGIAVVVLGVTVYILWPK